MSRYGREEFSEASTALLKRHTEVVLSPLNDQATKATAGDLIFGQVGSHHHGVHPRPEVAIDAMTASLLRLDLSDRRERVALGYIARHIDSLPPEKAADAAFVALRHVQYTSWAMMNVRKTAVPKEREYRLNLESEKLADLQRQMDRLARQNPEVWDSKKEEFATSLNQGTILADKVRAMPKLASVSDIAPQRRAIPRRRRAQEFAAA